MSWNSALLEEVADFRLGKMLDAEKNRGELKPYLANVNVRWGEFELSDLREMRFEEHEIERFSLRDGDIVMCEGGEPGRCAIWKAQRSDMMIQIAIHRIRPHDGLDNRFLFYSFVDLGKRGVLSGMFTGSTIKHLPREKLALVRVPIPPIDVQRRIADVLSGYDDLIENNRRRMELLEASARHLYEEWFVRLRFPGHEHTRITDGVPKGWTRTMLQAVCTKVGSGFTPRGGKDSYQSEGITLIRSLNVYNDRFEDDGLAFISDEQADDLKNVAVESRDILLNITGASVARCCMAPERFLPARVNQHVMIIRVDPGLADPFFVHKAINSDERKRQLLSFAQKGSTREALTKEMVSNFEIAIPPPSFMVQYGALASDCFAQCENLASQNLKLKSARDHLLPRLMSGEVPV